MCMSLHQFSLCLSRGNEPKKNHKREHIHKQCLLIIFWLFECTLFFLSFHRIYSQFSIYALYPVIGLVSFYFTLLCFTFIYLFIYLFSLFFVSSFSLYFVHSFDVSIHFRANWQTSLNAYGIINVGKMNGNHYSLQPFCSF